jgi:hypothetical protein
MPNMERVERFMKETTKKSTPTTKKELKKPEQKKNPVKMPVVKTK